jgi:hypothetical protein
MDVVSQRLSAGIEKMCALQYRLQGQWRLTMSRFPAYTLYCHPLPILTDLVQRHAPFPK